MRCHSWIIKKLKSSCRKSNQMKFMVKVPLNVEESKEVYQLNGNILWEDSIKKDMKNTC